MMEMHCPGHFGHIELPVPVYNPLIFSELLTLIKLVCFNCHHFRMEMAKVRPTIDTFRLFNALFEFQPSNLTDRPPLLSLRTRDFYRPYPL